MRSRQTRAREGLTRERSILRDGRSEWDNEPHKDRGGMPLKEGQREGVRVASSLVAFLPRGRRGVLRVPVIGPLSCCYVRSGGGGVGVGGGGGGEGLSCSAGLCWAFASLTIGATLAELFVEVLSCEKFGEAGGRL